MSEEKDEHSTSSAEGEGAVHPVLNEAGAETPAEAQAESAPASGASAPAGEPAPSNTADFKDSPILRPAPEARRPRSPWLPLATAIVTGSLIAVGGAFGLRYLDAAKPDWAGLGQPAVDFNARAAALEQKINEASSASRAALAALDGRISSLANETGKSEAAAKSALDKLEQAIAARPAQTAAQGSSTDAPEPPDLGPIQKRLDAIEQKASALEAQLAAPKANVRAQEPRENVKAEPQSQGQSAAQGHSVAIVAGSLLGKIQRGAPFATDLSALETLGVGAGELAPLRPHAAAGVASERTLTEQFAPLISPILASEPPKEHESFIDELTRGASKLVHIHRDDGTGGEDLQGLVDKIESAIAQHDIEDAFALWSKLPDAAKAKSQSWGEAAKARLDALAAARAIEADAVAIVAKPKS
jgi:hypothetical protein